MSFWSDLMQYGYLQNAFWAATLSGVACALVGCYVVARRMVFLAGGITHASFGGLGIAFWAGSNPIIGALLFAVGSALGIEWASEKGRIRSDSAIGILWAAGMATGALFMSLRPGYTSGDMTAYLFGSIITVTRGDIAALALLTAGLVVGALCWLRPLFYVAFDRDYAQTRGIPTRTVSYLMAALMALTIVLSIRVMGIVLLVALITIPAVVANTLSRDYRQMALIAPIVGVIGNLTGLILSYQWDIAPGVAIIFTLLVGLIAVKLLTLWHKNAQTQE